MGRTLGEGWARFSDFKCYFSIKCIIDNAICSFNIYIYILITFFFVAFFYFALVRPCIGEINIELGGGVCMERS